MKYKSRFTPFDAVIYALDLEDEGFSDVEALRDMLNLAKNKMDFSNVWGSDVPRVKLLSSFIDRAEKALELYDGLAEEIMGCIESGFEIPSNLLIYNSKGNKTDLTTLDNSLVEKQSLARWLVDFDEIELAKKFNDYVLNSSSSINTHQDVGEIKIETLKKVANSLLSALAETDEAFKKNSDVFVGYSKASGDSGIVGYLITKEFTSLSSSTLEKYLREILKTK